MTFRKVHEKLDFLKLKKAELVTKGAPAVTTLTCDMDECDGPLAAIYCLNCTEKLCETHEEVRMVLLADYSSRVDSADCSMN